MPHQLRDILKEFEGLSPKAFSQRGMQCSFQVGLRIVPFYRDYPDQQGSITIPVAVMLEHCHWLSLAEILFGFFSMECEELIRVIKRGIPPETTIQFRVIDQVRFDQFFTNTETEDIFEGDAPTVRANFERIFNTQQHTGVEK